MFRELLEVFVLAIICYTLVLGGLDVLYNQNKIISFFKTKKNKLK